MPVALVSGFAAIGGFVREWVCTDCEAEFDGCWRWCPECGSLLLVPAHDIRSEAEKPHLTGSDGYLMPLPGR